MAATFVVAIEASAPTPASRADQARRLTMSLSMAPESMRRPRREASWLQAPADGLRDVVLGQLRGVVALVEEAEDPAGEDLLDRSVEGHRRELGGHRVAELARALRFLHDPLDLPVGLGDLAEVRRSEGVRRARDLDDDHLHQVRVVTIG